MVMASGSADYLGLANAPVLWILALAVMGVVVVQSLIYMNAVKKNAEGDGAVGWGSWRYGVMVL